MDDYDHSDQDFEELENLNFGPISVQGELERFRKKWKEELKHKCGEGSLPNRVSGQGDDNANMHAGLNYEEGPSIEEQARFLFLQGVSAEQNGRFFDAIAFYRRAVQLVPDIEFKIDEYKPNKIKKGRTISECSVDSTGSVLAEDEDPEDLEDLLGYFQKLKITDKGLCLPMFESKSTHISCLPVELMNYIFKWTVSSELDVISLEYLSQVSRGFYVSARDEELWRLICQRVWGRNCGDTTNYGSYRNMYYMRAHIRFNGLYISKCCYYRQGEKGLDIYYRPYQLVEYYRYIKFFPNGKMLMLTTPEDPLDVIPKLRSHHSKVQGILSGYFRLTGDMVSAILKRKQVEFKSPYERFRRKNRNEPTEEQIFNVEFTLCNSGKRQHSQLNWNHYSYNTYNNSTGDKTETEFQLNNQSYPSLVFSRVKSYTATAEKPLN